MTVLLSFAPFNTSVNVFMRHRMSQGLVTPIVSDQDKQDSTFLFNDADWQLGNVVQLHAAIPLIQDHVLRHSNSNFVLEVLSDQNHDAASFRLVGGLVNPNVGINKGGLVSFQSFDVPDSFIMQRESALVLERPDDFGAQEAATWFVNAPNAFG
jgi:hypothetical protein